MLNIIILAAGKGSRMQSDIPKALHIISGKYFIEHLLDNIKILNADNIFVVVGYKEDCIKKALNNYDDIIFISQKDQLGTGHAVMQAIPFLNQNMNYENNLTLILYSDIPLIQIDTLKKLISYDYDLFILTNFLEDPTGYGRIIRNKNNHVYRIVEHKDASDDILNIKEVNTGIFSVKTDKLKKWLNLITKNSQNEYYLTDIVNIAFKESALIKTLKPNFSWEALGVNSRTQLADLERLWQQYQSNLLLQQGVTLADPNRIDIRGNLICDNDVFIDIGCIFLGNVKLSKGVRIGPYCIIKESIIGEYSNILAYSYIEGSEIGVNVQIGPFARLRPKVIIRQDVRIGNFVEIKNSTIGKASKASHLSYIGDSDIGKDVNIGAGVITCNYDGINKNETIIEDNVFVGANSQLIAPIRIGKGSTIGAGSTITNDVSENHLTLSRSPQISIKKCNKSRKIKK